MKHFADKNDHHGDEEEEEENDLFPYIARGDITHSVYRSLDDVTRICAHVTNTAAVAVCLNRQHYNSLEQSAAACHVCNITLFRSRLKSEDTPL